MKEEHIVRRMLDVEIPRKRIRGRPNLRWKDACKRHDRYGSERGQDNKQGSMEEYHHTGQAREEEDYKLASSSWKCAVYKLNPKQVIIRRINYVLD